MTTLIYSWLIVFAMGIAPKDMQPNTGTMLHPIFVSVTTIDHNAANKTLEITCKIFTDDLEKTLRKKSVKKVDLLDPKFNEAMKPLVNDYIQKHLSIAADGKPTVLKFLGFEQQEEGIMSYFEVENIVSVKKIEVTDSILYEEKPEQMQIIHVTVDGKRKSNKLNNPDTKTSFLFP